MSDLYMNEWKSFLSELEAAPKKAVKSLDKFRKDMLGGGAKSSAPFTKDGFPKDFNKPEEFSAPPAMEEGVEEDKLFKPLSKSQKAHSSKLIRVKYKERPLDADGVIDPKVAKGEKESLDEIKMDQVMPRFDSKAFKNAMEQKYDVPPGRLALINRRDPREIRDMVPDDIEEKYKPEALNWLITTYINDPEFKSSLIYNRFPKRQGTRKSLEIFYQIKQVKPSLLSKNDIYSIKTLQEFLEVVEAAKPAWEQYSQAKADKDASLGTNKIHEDEEWEVYVPENKGAACRLGKNTDWCTAAPGLDYYSYYHKENDPLFIFISKKDPSEKYQFSYGSDQFMDRNDRDLRRSGNHELAIFFKLNGLLASIDNPRVSEKIKNLAQNKAENFQKLPNGGFKIYKDYGDEGQEYYYDKENRLHNDDGPAIIQYYNGVATEEYYYWHGEPAMSKQGYEAIKSQESLKEMVKEEIMNLLYEKKDRCYAIAKRKYKAFPSAYASGAIVKCRQGKIWKKEK